MRLDECVAWYQKKIGTYDKQQWEKTVEQKILNGISSVTLKTGTLKTEYIDVDLVRGSTFPKAKPKQSLLTVIRLAILRYLFLPCYAKFWSTQTSPKIFTLLLFLYVLQMINWAVYSFNIQKIDSEHIVSIFELIIPMLLGLALSLIHSQIVATSSGISNSRNNRKHLCHNNKKNKDTIKRRKKYVRLRTQDSDSSQGKFISIKKSSLKCPENHTEINTNIVNKNLNNDNHDMEVEIVNQTYNLDKNDDIKVQDVRKRNVNWDSPIHNFAVESHIDNLSRSALNFPDKNSPSIENVVQEFFDDLVQEIDNRSNEEQIVENQRQQLVDDDGFESFNGKSSSGGEDTINRHRNNNQYLVQNRPENFQSNNLLHRRKIFSNLKLDCDKFPNVKAAAKNKNNKSDNGSTDTDEENDDNDILSPPLSNYSECTTSATEWLGVTTNSDECSYSSEPENSDLKQNFSDEYYDYTPTVLLNSCGTSEKITCTVWDSLHEIKKAEMSVLDISSCIIEKVEAMPETCDYIYIGVTFSIILSLVPTLCRLCELTVDAENSSEINYLEIPQLIWEKASFSFLKIALGASNWEKIILSIGLIQRLVLNFILFFLFAVAERTFKQRFLYAKLFSHLTSSRRASKSSLPHFRLNKVRNIKTWLSVRSYLKRRGPQRSIDVIVSAAFMITLLLLAILSVEWLKDTHNNTLLTLEALLWSSTLGVFLLRFMTLGNKINRKYRSISVLITEQINLYLQIEQKPKKKDELMVSNAVLKLAADLLKELESPFKISGLSANPYLYTTVKVVIMSALSGVLSEMLGFKLKLHKIKIK